MASRKQVTDSLMVLAANFSGAVTAEKVKLWVIALGDVSDADLCRAVAHVVKTYQREFLPPVAVIRAAAAAGGTDAEALLCRIDLAGSYNPQTGWTPPRLEAVRQQFGDAVAEAYGLAGGGSRLFASNETTRDIAARDFAEALKAAAPGGLSLPAPAIRAALPAPVELDGAA